MGLIAFLLAIVGVAFLYKDAAIAAAEFWRGSHNYKHGALLVVVVLGILAMELAKKKPQFATHRVLLVAAIFTAASVLVISTVATVLVVQMSFLTIVIWLVIAALFGEAEAKRLLLPVALVAFAIPIWDFMIVPLQKMTIFIVNYFLDVSRRTSYIEGDYVILRYGTFYVQKGCSGMNFLITGVMLSGLYAHWFLEGWRKRFKAILVGASASVVANWIRVFVVVIAGDLSKMQHWLVDNHIGFGWIVFALIMGTLLLLGSRNSLKNSSDESNNKREAGSRLSSGWSRRDNSTTFIPWVRNTALIFSAVALPAAIYALANSFAGPPGPVSIELPHSIGSARRTVSVGDSGLATQFPDAANRVSTVYQFDGKDVVVDVFAYDLRDKDAELVGYPNQWFDEKIWRIISRADVGENFKNWVRDPVRFHLESKSKSRAVVVSYYVGESNTASDVEAKALGTINYFLGVYLGAAVIISMECEGDCVSEGRTVAKTAESILNGNAIGLTSTSN